MIAARVIGANGKASAWSNYVVLPVVPAAGSSHSDLKAASTPARRTAHLAVPAAQHFRVLRKAGDDPQYAP